MSRKSILDLNEALVSLGKVSELSSPKVTMDMSICAILSVAIIFLCKVLEQRIITGEKK